MDGQICMLWNCKKYKKIGLISQNNIMVLFFLAAPFYLNASCITNHPVFIYIWKIQIVSKVLKNKWKLELACNWVECSICIVFTFLFLYWLFFVCGHMYIVCLYIIVYITDTFIIMMIFRILSISITIRMWYECCYIHYHKGAHYVFDMNVDM